MHSAIVIGGGIIGASAAFHLARDGVKTTLIDRADPGNATYAGAGIVAPGTAGDFPPATVEFTKHAVRYFPPLLELLQELGTPDPSYRVTGKLMIAMNEAEDARLEHVMKTLVQRRDDGMPNLGDLSWLTSAEARELFPPLAMIHHAIHVAGAARVDGNALRNALVAGARHYGASTLTGSAILDVHHAQSPAVTLDGERHEADVVVLATGSWINDLLGPLDIELPVRPHRGQIVHLSLDETDTSEWPMVVPLDGKYILPFEPNRIVTGATQEPDAGFDARPTAEGVHLVLHRALENAPGLAAATLDEVRVGLRPWSADGAPYLGAVPGAEDVIVATGFGASGLHLGPYAGLAISRLVQGAAQDTDLSPFRIDREISPS